MLKAILSDQTANGSPVTIIVGLKCVDGAVVASDSQQEFGRGVAVKRLNTGKIYRLGDRFAIAGAGMTAHIEKAVESLLVGFSEAKRRKGGTDLNQSDCISVMERTMTAVYKEYNIDRSKFLGDPREREFFNPILICGAIESYDGKEDIGLYIVHAEGIVERISDYATAGSGAAYAELLLKNLYYNKMSVDEAIPAAIYTIDEVKTIDPNCGGETRVTIVKPKEGIAELPGTKISQLSNKIKPALDRVAKDLIPRILRGDLNEEKVRKIIR